MGIENFNQWIRSDYPESISKNYQRDGKPVIRDYHHIYVDGNSILHNAIYTADNQTRFLTLLYNRLDSIFETNYATKSITLAIDGPGVFLKIDLQRKRRQTVDYNTDKLSSLCLTPGTKFMDSLNNHLKSYIESRKRRYKYRNIEFRLYSSKEPDEGEIKLLKKMRNNSTKDSNDTHLIVGNDADLIVMSACLGDVNGIEILIKDFKGYSLFNLDKFLRVHSARWMMINGEGCFRLNENMIRRDFAAISIMMGNDYIPRLGCAKFETMWRGYKNTREIHQLSFLMYEDNGEIHFNMLFFAEFLRQYISMCPVQYRKPKDEILTDELNNYLSGVLWCIDMYRDGVCKMYDFELETNIKPSAPDILKLIELGCMKCINPKSNTTPMSPEVCGVILLPKRAVKLLPDKIAKIALSKLDRFYEIEDCKQCNKFKLDHYDIQKKITAERSMDEPNNNILKILRSKMRMLSLERDIHMAKHNVMSISEARYTLEKNLI